MPRETASPDREFLKKCCCVAVSACLLGENCKYNGGNNLNKELAALLEDKTVVAVCPEILGGLSVPRKPCEIKNGRVIDTDRLDVTKFFRKGALSALKTVTDCGAEMVILQPRSPSCGSKQIYDGTFSKKLAAGQGVFAKLLAEHGIKIIDADEL